jgi:uracil-DNA glycosylase
VARKLEVVRALEAIHRDIQAFRHPELVGPPVHGPPVASRVFLLGQAPGPHEARFGRPFAWTAGKTMFRWFERAFGASEEEVRRRVYMAAVVRSFPGKTPHGGDRVPSRDAIEASRRFIQREIEVLRPRLIVPVGRLAIEQVLGRKEPIATVVGRKLRAHFHGVNADVISLPHPSGASTWVNTEPGKGLLRKALRLLGNHPEIRRAFSASRPRAGTARSRGRSRGRPQAEGGA